MSDSPPQTRRRIERFEELRVVSMSGVDEERLVYDVYHREMPLLGLRPDGSAEILVSFAPDLVGTEITLGVLRALFADIENRVERERLDNEAAEIQEKAD